MCLLVVVAVAEPHGLPVSRPTVGQINNLEEKTEDTAGARMRGLNGRERGTTRQTSAEQIRRRCTHVHKLPSNNVSLLSKFMESLRAKQETTTVNQRAASRTRCQPPAWQQSSTASYGQYRVGQTAVKVAVAEVWHTLLHPPSHTFPKVGCRVRILEGTKESRRCA